ARGVLASLAGGAPCPWCRRAEGTDNARRRARAQTARDVASRRTSTRNSSQEFARFLALRERPRLCSNPPTSGVQTHGWTSRRASGPREPHLSAAAAEGPG